jgi:hypothetical protein
MRSLYESCILIGQKSTPVRLFLPSELCTETTVQAPAADIVIGKASGLLQALADPRTNGGGRSFVYLSLCSYNAGLCLNKTFFFPGFSRLAKPESRRTLMKSGRAKPIFAGISIGLNLTLNSGAPKNRKPLTTRHGPTSKWKRCLPESIEQPAPSGANTFTPV